MSQTQSTTASLNLTLSPDDLETIANAAAQSNKSEADFVLNAALEKAQTSTTRPDATYEEMMELVRKAQEEMRLANPTGRNLLQELLDERRAEAASE